MSENKYRTWCLWRRCNGNKLLLSDNWVSDEVGPFGERFKVIEHAALTDLQARAKKLVGALEFYSNDNDWGLDWDLVNNPSAIQDRGKKARQALKEYWSEG